MKEKHIQTIGTVLEVRDSIVIATGLSTVGYHEVVTITAHNSGEVIQGLALNLEQESVGIVVLGDFKKIHAGDTVISTGKQLSIEAGEFLKGAIISPLGISQESDKTHMHNSSGDTMSMTIERAAPGVIVRKDVTRSLLTGILSIDSMIPIGKGQRQLIIGDRQTGKTAVAVDTILNQRGKQVTCIYVAIGQKASKIAQLKKKLTEAGAMEYTIIVNAAASDPVSLQYIAPYVGCSIGEYFAEKGEDALVVYDDLTKHAFAYREISLLLRRPPGREAYPGDIFYLHSRLLERSAQYADEKKGGSLTALPIVETQAGDVSAYIPTNIISITDGQIYLDADLFNAGQRPAINVGISVSRVGSAAQKKSMKSVAGKLKLQLAQFRELQAFSQFGADLDEDTIKKLHRGTITLESLKQRQYAPYELAEQIVILYTFSQGIADSRSREQIIPFVDVLLKTLAREEYLDLRKVLNTSEEKITPETETRMKQLISDSETQFSLWHSNNK